MKFLVLLIGQGEVRPWDTQTPEEQGEEMERFGAFESACEAHDGVDLSEATVADWLRDRIVRWWMPDRIVFEAVPLTATGKIDKKAIRVRHARILNPVEGGL